MALEPKKPGAAEAVKRVARCLAKGGARGSYYRLSRGPGSSFG